MLSWDEYNNNDEAIKPPRLPEEQFTTILDRNSIRKRHVDHKGTWKSYIA